MPYKKVKVGNDQEMVQSERNSHTQKETIVIWEKAMHAHLFINSDSFISFQESNLYQELYV